MTACALGRGENIFGAALEHINNRASAGARHVISYARRRHGGTPHLAHSRASLSRLYKMVALTHRSWRGCHHVAAASSPRTARARARFLYQRITRTHTHASENQCI